ncbi:MAG: DEAD/DEAH box helicase family protein [Bacteroidales bacterium]|nr:DEAD/DEAH box helicase family protein [Bacteroidales bacterium]
MLQEVKDLQQRAVKELVALSDINEGKDEITFRAPTGSGKTHMMADYMNRILSANENIIFLVSTLSKGGLARQNYEVFKRLKDNNTFPSLKPFLISSQISTEENLYIPTDCNVYVLPRDLYKKGGRLMQGAMTGFLQTMTHNLFGAGQNKQIYLIKDECHQATKNLDNLSKDFFSKVLNFSATPKLTRGQIPDVQITDEEAVQAKLIKQIQINDLTQEEVNLYKLEDINKRFVEQSIEKLEEIKNEYIQEIGVNPCLIIQISNKDKADKEWQNIIKPVLDKHQALKWMLIVDKDKDCDTNDDIKKKLPVNKWKDYAKGSSSTIDVIIFKMVISEGWDIPRACMLCQVRKTISDQLDEQVIGRVRRNPRLTDFENLTLEAQRLAMTSWIWGAEPKDKKKSYKVSLIKSFTSDIQNNIQVRTTKLSNLLSNKTFNIETFIDSKKDKTVNDDIFSLYAKLNKQENDLQSLCYDYAGQNVKSWVKFTENIDAIKREYTSYICDYRQSMKEDKLTSFPLSSVYSENDIKLSINNWVWQKRDNNRFAFDSEAERWWAEILQEISENHFAKLETLIDKEDYKLLLWGKNYPYNSDIKYEYYDEGIHKSYPDFIMKDKKGRIHIFEVKSINQSNSININNDDYLEKIDNLKECYKVCSEKLSNHIFYIPILKGEEWFIYKYENGEEDAISESTFKHSLE